MVSRVDPFSVMKVGFLVSVAMGIALVVMTEEQSRTLPLWLRGFVQASASRETDWGQVMAASTLVAVPVIIFFLVVQGRMSSGLVGGAVKG